MSRVYNHAAIQEYFRSNAKVVDTPQQLNEIYAIAFINQPGEDGTRDVQLGLHTKLLGTLIGPKYNKEITVKYGESKKAFLAAAVDQYLEVADEKSVSEAMKEDRASGDASGAAAMDKTGEDDIDMETGGGDSERELALMPRLQEWMQMVERREQDVVAREEALKQREVEVQAAESDHQATIKDREKHVKTLEAAVFHQRLGMMRERAMLDEARHKLAQD
ncbi:hypothetical protein AC579_10577 [Pseudocercospora musae]|uniref:Uncharacterized protein n=1 Tax=Pseudocercospora musae TaxID=113226 RepID=A0A139GSZ7_9PEZI|nr:hypothetical protein AC579_10577 [Pseudocercospora musae]